MTRADRIVDALLWRCMWLIALAGIAWRIFTALVDGWQDLRRGRVPPRFRRE